MERKRGIFFILSIMTIAILFILNIIVGSVNIPMRQLWDMLTGHYTGPETLLYIVTESRLPRAVTALLSGAALAGSGLVLQTLFRNPLAGPSILGISSGASLGVAVVTLFLGGILTIGAQGVTGDTAIIIGALAGSALIIVILTAAARKVKSNLMLLIIGIMTGYLTSAIVSLLTSFASANDIQAYAAWGLGTFSAVTLRQLPFFTIVMLFGLGATLLLIKPLDALLLGDNYALSLGVRTHRVRLWLMTAGGLLTAVVTAYCGPVSFVGVATPHIARLIWRTDRHIILFRATMLAGAVVTLLCNLCSTAFTSTVIPINALTPVIGAPVILYIIIAQRSR